MRDSADVTRKACKEMSNRARLGAPGVAGATPSQRFSRSFHAVSNFPCAGCVTSLTGTVLRRASNLSDLRSAIGYSSDKLKMKPRTALGCSGIILCRRVELCSCFVVRSLQTDFRTADCCDEAVG